MLDIQDLTRNTLGRVCVIIITVKFEWQYLQLEMIFLSGIVYSCPQISLHMKTFSEINALKS